MNPALALIGLAVALATAAVSGVSSAVAAEEPTDHVIAEFPVGGLTGGPGTIAAFVRLSEMTGGPTPVIIAALTFSLTPSDVGTTQ